MTALPDSFVRVLEEKGISITPRVCLVSISEQKLYFHSMGHVREIWKISTSKKGVGQRMDTGMTPLGLHRIREKIGDQASPGTIFVSRKAQVDRWDPQREPVEKDLITTRILWLEGMEPGWNQGTNAEGESVDSYQRYIYIHGTNHEDQLGQPCSIGCIRMGNREVIELFDQIQIGDLVWIQESELTRKP